MSTRSKQIAWYSVGVPMGERPRSVPSVGIGGDTAHVNVAGISGTVTLGTGVSQLLAARVNVAGISSSVALGREIVSEIATVNMVGLAGSIRLGNVIASPSIAHANVAAISATVGSGRNLAGGVAHVNAAGISATVVRTPRNIDQDDTATVNVVANNSSVTLPPVGAKEITQATAAAVNVAGNLSAVSGRPLDIVQHTPAGAAVSGNLGAVSLFVTQNAAARVYLAGISSSVLLQGLIASTTGRINIAANGGVVVLGSNISPEAATFRVAANASQVRVGLTFASGTAHVNMAGNAGTVALGSDVVQSLPAYVNMAGISASATLTPSIPQEIVQNETAEIVVEAGIGLAGVGGDAFCRWFAPPDCLGDATIARKIMYKQPAEEMWLAYNFRNRLAIGEEITSVVDLDDGGTGVIASPGIIQGYDSGRNEEVKYLTVNGIDLTNVRIQHRVLTSEGRTLEGDGFLYVRGEL